MADRPVSKAITVSVIGGSKVPASVCELAEEVGRLLARRGVIVFCGGLSGVMECVSKGVREENGIVIGILPGTSTDEGNPYLTVGIPTGIGFARNFLVSRAGDAIIAIDGSTGTHSEASFALAEGKDVVVLGDLTIETKKEGEGKIIRVTTPEEAVERAISIATERRHLRV
ncbi:MAG: TIGR00725 family protein [Thermoplasmatales archaeon]